MDRKRQKYIQDRIDALAADCKAGRISEDAHTKAVKELLLIRERLIEE